MENEDGNEDRNDGKHRNSRIMEMGSNKLDDYPATRIGIGHGLMDIQVISA